MQGGPIQLRSRVGGDAQARIAPGRSTSFVEPEPAPGSDGPDESYRLAPLLTAIRWATTAVSLLLLSTGETTGKHAVIAAAIISYSLWRTVRPLQFTGPTPVEVGTIVAEGALMVAAVIATDFWSSPYVFGLVTVISAAGFAGGIPWALPAALGCVAAMAVPYHLADSQTSTKLTVQWAGELTLVAILAGYVRHLSLQARAESSRYVGRLRQLSQVNDLLLQLRRVAQTLPMSLDLEETLDSSVTRLRELFEPDTVVVMLRDDGLWSVGRASGVQLPRTFIHAELPPVVRQAADGTTAVTVLHPDDVGTRRLASESQAGMYARLAARKELVGVVAVERRTPEPFDAHQVAVMEEFCQQMAISIDNARWFSRIGTLAAEQERSRIARDLHDRVGQSLALVGFELDRVGRKSLDAEVGAQLLELREHVRSVVTELRETLYDLRTDVSEERDVVAALAEFLDRVHDRSGLEVSLEDHSSRRLALTVEREVWRIAQEAVFNAERHARATSVSVTWTSDAGGAELCVADDGEGMAPATSRSEGYGLLGMQERAHAIGAVLGFTSSPGGGTLVRLTLRR